MNRYTVTDASGVGLGQFSKDQLDWCQGYANMHNVGLVVTDSSGSVVDRFDPVKKSRSPYPFDRVQALVRVHIDDKAKIHELAKQLNDQRTQ